MCGLCCNIFLIVIFFNVLYNNKNAIECGGPVKMWLTGIVLYYILDFILNMVSYHYLKTYNKDSYAVWGFRYVLLVFMFGWLVYGNFIYWSPDYFCDKLEETRWLDFLMFLSIIFGYFEMLKCFCISLLICFIVPMLFFANRRA